MAPENDDPATEPTTPPVQTSSEPSPRGAENVDEGPAKAGGTMSDGTPGGQQPQADDIVSIFNYDPFAQEEPDEGDEERPATPPAQRPAEQPATPGQQPGAPTQQRQPDGGAQTPQMPGGTGGQPAQPTQPQQPSAPEAYDPMNDPEALRAALARANAIIQNNQGQPQGQQPQRQPWGTPHGGVQQPGQQQPQPPQAQPQQQQQQHVPDFNYAMPEALVQRLRSEDDREFSQGLSQLVSAIGSAIYAEVMPQVQTTFEGVQPMISTAIQRMQVQQAAEADFFEAFPDLRKPALRPIIHQVTSQMLGQYAHQFGGIDNVPWTPKLRDAIGKTVKAAIAGGTPPPAAQPQVPQPPLPGGVPQLPVQPHRGGGGGGARQPSEQENLQLDIEQTLFGGYRG